VATGASAVPDGWADQWRALIESWNRGERAADYPFLHPEFELDSSLTDAVFRGPSGLWDWYREIEEQFDRWAIEVDDEVEESGSRSLMSGTIHFRGRESGIEMDSPIYWVFEFEDGLVRRFSNYLDLDQAKRAL
jgi:ketosteroid isomerase-like protein